MESRLYWTDLTPGLDCVYEEKHTAVEGKRVMGGLGLSLMPDLRSQIVYVHLKAIDNYGQLIEREAYIYDEERDFLAMMDERDAKIVEEIIDFDPFYAVFSEDYYENKLSQIRFEVEPVMVVPLDDGELDTLETNWVLSTKDGYIYGRRDGKMYELEHHHIKIPELEASIHLFTLGDFKTFPLDEADKVNLILTKETDKYHSEQHWYRELIRRYSQFKVEGAKRGWTVENKVHYLSIGTRVAR